MLIYGSLRIFLGRLFFFLFQKKLSPWPLASCWSGSLLAVDIPWENVGPSGMLGATRFSFRLTDDLSRLLLYFIFFGGVLALPPFGNTHVYCERKEREKKNDLAS